MKKIVLAFFVLTALSVTSCFDHEFKHESIHKGEILKYLSTLKSIDPDQIQQIDELESKLDFRDVEVYNLKTTERLIIARVKSLEAFRDADEIKAIFYLNQNEIVRSNIVTFHDAGTPSNYDEVIISMVDRREKTYSGKISFHSAFQSLFLFSELDNGRLIENGIALPKKSIDKGGRTEACTDWYLVTTTYYASGATRRSEYYLYTTCDCEANETRMGRAACGGGGTPGGNGATLSPNAPHGSEVEYVDKNGKYILYRYNAYISTWEIVLITLPVVEFESDPYTFPDLAAIHYPVHGMVIAGDNLIFTYDAHAGKWFGTLCIQNWLKNPCLRKVADKALSPSVPGKLNDMIQEIFNKNEAVNLILKEGAAPGGLASTGNAEEVDGVTNVTITMDPTKFTGKPEEFIAASVYHESLHAIINYLSDNNYPTDAAHVAMFTKYLESLGAAVEAAYAGKMQAGDGKGLILYALKALDEQFFPAGTPRKWKTEFVNEVFKKTGMTRVQVDQILGRYLSNSSGTPCNQ